MSAHRHGGGRARAAEAAPLAPAPILESLTQAVLVATAAVSGRPAWFVAVAAIISLSISLSLVVDVRRAGPFGALRAAPRHVLAASLVHLAAIATGGLGIERVSDSALVLRTAAGGAGYAVFEAHDRRQRRRPPLRQTWPLDLGVACSAALLALAYRQGGLLLTPIALVPLLISRFSYARYALAHDAFHQTVAALAVVPEVAGLVTVGHSERTAHYAAAMCDLLGLPQAARERVTTAARLHHVGALALPGADEEMSFLLTSEVIARSAEVVRSTGLPDGVSRVLLAMRAVDRPSFRDCGLEAAIVSVASDFDDLVGEDPARAPWALGLLALHVPDASTRVALATLEQVVSSGATAGTTAGTATATTVIEPDVAARPG